MKRIIDVNQRPIDDINHQCFGSVHFPSYPYSETHRSDQLQAHLFLVQSHAVMLQKIDAIDSN